MRKILFIGHGKHLYEKAHWAKAAMNDGYEVSFAGYDDSDYAQKITRSGLTYKSIGSRPEFTGSIMSEALFANYMEEQRAKLSRVIEDFTPDIVHIINVVHLFVATAIIDHFGIPSLTSTTGLGFVAQLIEGQDGTRQHLMDALKDSCDLSKGMVSFQNEDDVDLFTERKIVSPERAIIVPGSGVDLSLYPEVAEVIDDETLRVTQIGRLSRQKGTHVFAEAARILNQRSNIKYRFDLYGSVNRREIDTDDFVREPNITWHGHTSDVVTNAILPSNIVCQPSTEREGAPRSLIEASACARAVITSDIPGCRQVVQNEVSGLVVKPSDASELAAAIDKLARDPHGRQKMGKNGRKIVSDRYSSAVITRMLTERYQQLV